MTSLIERELSRTQFKSMVVMVWHVVEDVCKDEAVQISGVNKNDTMFWSIFLLYYVRYMYFIKNLYCNPHALL
jgi:hypothetical protein